MEAITTPTFNPSKTTDGTASTIWTLPSCLSATFTKPTERQTIDVFIKIKPKVYAGASAYLLMYKRVEKDGEIKKEAPLPPSDIKDILDKQI